MSTLAVNSITDANAGNTATINSMTPTADSLQGFRNRIINGDMRIDQRNAGAAVTSQSGYVVDRLRFQRYATDQLAWSWQQDSSAPVGFVNSVKLTVTTAETSITDEENCFVAQRIEGTNVADLAWGTANAKTVTLSFWVRSSLTGTFGGAAFNYDQSRNYPFSYSISAANTWEYKTVTIPGDTTGTWLTTNGSGIGVSWAMGNGSDRLGTAGAWTSSLHLGVTGQVQIAETLNATWYITGVQLEVGSVATPFERRPYGTELSLCQRYYYLLVSGTSKSFMNGSALSAGQVRGHVQLPVTMRTAPSINQTSGSNYYQFDASTAVFVNDFQTAYSTDTGILLYQSGISATAGQGGTWLTTNSSAYIAFSAEL